MINALLTHRCANTIHSFILKTALILWQDGDLNIICDSLLAVSGNCLLLLLILLQANQLPETATAELTERQSGHSNINKSGKITR